MQIAVGLISVGLAPVVAVGRFPTKCIRQCLINLPGWRWAAIKQAALDRLSRSLHSDVCDSDGCNNVVLHSTISGRGGRRERAALNISSIKSSGGWPGACRTNGGILNLLSVWFAPVAVMGHFPSSATVLWAIIPSRPFGYDQV